MKQYKMKTDQKHKFYKHFDHDFYFPHVLDRFKHFGKFDLFDLGDPLSKVIWR